MHKKTFIIIFTVISLLLFINEYTDVFKPKGSFEEIILERFNEKQFRKLRITKIGDPGDYETKSNSDPQTINQFLEYLKELEIKEISRKNVPKSRSSYEISINNSMYERIFFEVINEEYIRLYTKTYEKKIDKGKNMITYKDITINGFYKLTDKKLDYDYLDEIFSNSESRGR